MPVGQVTVDLSHGGERMASEHTVADNIVYDLISIQTLKQLIEAGPSHHVIAPTHVLNEVPDAVGYLEERHAQGMVAITV